VKGQLQEQETGNWESRYPNVSLERVLPAEEDLPSGDAGKEGTYT